MHTIPVELQQNGYPIYCGMGILPSFGRILQEHRPIKQAAIITQKNIDSLYGEILRKSLSNCELLTITVPDGEQAKSPEELHNLYTRLLEHRFERSSVIIALGGGVVGDLAGYAAATYLRGVDLVQVPTTLLAQVDSSIGGKTGINHPLGKNLIGAFKQPLFVYADTSTLQTLPDEEIRCGLGEVIKYGFILNEKLFAYLEKNLEKALDKDPAVLEHLARVSAQEKARVVAQDEKESNLRMILNYGHTFGHALEAELHFSGIKHGEAVILGMQCALEYQRLAGTIADEDCRRGMALLKRVLISFPREQLNPDLLVEHMSLDKKVKDKNIRLILLEKIGRYAIEQSADINLLKEAFKIVQ